MNKDFNEIFSSLSNAFEQLNVLFKNNADTVLLSYTFAEMHCIEQIEKIDNPNVTKISKALNFTRGGISKIIKKLISKKAIQAYKSENNKKETYYRLTPNGKIIFEAHEKLHKKWGEYDKDFYTQFSDEEIENGLNFIKKYNEHLNEIIKNFK